ncbi:MAG: hypothetical protein CM1200mP26_00110 [Acidimicrobiales bacterium]|nr:MAG: hypothetical protein CM1200mP26_00110 [Acidimicrobiales bacterium]
MGSPNRTDATAIRAMVWSEPKVVALATEVWCSAVKKKPSSRANVMATGTARRTWAHVIRRPTAWSTVA